MKSKGQRDSSTVQKVLSCWYEVFWPEEFWAFALEKDAGTGLTQLGVHPPNFQCRIVQKKALLRGPNSATHPDVVIVFTSLNYYCAEICDDDRFLAFSHLSKSDQGDIEYQTWIVDAPMLPHTYRHLSGINLEDRYHYVEHVFSSLRFSKGAIDYFLAHIVFPKEMKEFPDKLSASRWDIGEVTKVGFSRTNNSRKILPLTVKQLDLPEQNHTNALVLFSDLRIRLLIFDRVRSRPLQTPKSCWTWLRA